MKFLNINNKSFYKELDFILKKRSHNSSTKIDNEVNQIIQLPLLEMVQNKCQTFLDNFSLIHLRAAFFLQPILQMGVVQIHTFEVVAPDVILTQNCFLCQRQEIITKS